MIKNTYGVGAIVVRLEPRTVQYAVLHYAGMGGGVPQFYVSTDRFTDQGEAISKAKKMNLQGRKLRQFLRDTKSRQGRTV